MSTHTLFRISVALLVSGFFALTIVWRIKGVPPQIDSPLTDDGYGLKHSRQDRNTSVMDGVDLENCS